VLRPEGFGSPFIGVLCARSPSFPRARVGPQQKTKWVGPEQKAKRGKGNDRWGRDVVEKDQGKGATICRNSGAMQKEVAGAQRFRHSALRAGGSRGLSARDFYHGRTISQAAAALRARARVKAEQENELTALVEHERFVREHEL
jgi:hypothetical protein